MTTKKNMREPIKPMAPTKPDPLDTVRFDWCDFDGGVKWMNEVAIAMAKRVANAADNAGFSVELDIDSDNYFDLCIDAPDAGISGDAVAAFTKRAEEDIYKTLPVVPGSLKLKLMYNYFPQITCDLMKSLEAVAEENADYERALEVYKEQMKAYEKALAIYNSPSSERERTRALKIKELKAQLAALERGT